MTRSALSVLMLLICASLAAANTSENIGQAEATRQIERMQQRSKQQGTDQARATPFVVPDWASDGRDREFGYTSMVRVSPELKVYYNLWWHNQRWYAMLPPDSVTDPALEEGFSTNMGVVRTPVSDMRTFARNIRFSVLEGNTLLIDFPFQAFYESLGHWAELMVPAYSTLREGSWVRHTTSNSTSIDRVVMPNMNRHVSHWFLRLFRLAMEPAKPPAQEAPSMLDFATMDKYDKLGWLFFENIFVVQDRYTHPQRKIGFAGSDHGDLWRYDGCDRYVSREFVPTFFKPEHGRDFRAAAYKSSNQAPVPEWTQDGTPPELPQQITFLVDGTQKQGQIKNDKEFMAMLQDVGEQFGLRVRKVVLSPDAPFDSHLDTMAKSAVVVGRHSNMFASAMFLKPGAMALEILPFKWEWHYISKLYYNVTASIGDIHHYAWRATDVKYCAYQEPHNVRYKDWYPGECHARECLLVHAKADVIVDIEEVRSKLVSKLTGMFAGKTVQELWEPWPEAV